MKTCSIIIIVVLTVLFIAGISSAAQQAVNPKVVTIQSKECSFCYPEFRACTANDCRSVQNGPFIVSLENLARTPNGIVAVLTVTNNSREKRHVQLQNSVNIDDEMGMQIQSKVVRIGTSTGEFSYAHSNIEGAQPLRATATFKDAKLSGKVTLSLSLYDVTDRDKGYVFTFFNLTIR